MKHWYIFFPFLVGQFGFDFTDPGTFLGDVLAFIQGEIVAALAFLFNLIVAVANFLIAVIEFVFNFFLTLARDIKAAFKWIWDNVIKVGLPKLLRGIVSAAKAVHDFAVRVVGWLNTLRKWYDQYFNQFVKPVLNAIRHLRQTLQIFRFLGFKWAARLDARLATIENRIVQAYELIRTHLNQVISFAQIIADPFGILRRNPLLAGILRNAPEIQNALDRATFHNETQKELDQSNRNNGWFQHPAAAGNAEFYSKGELPPDLAAARKEFLDAHAALPALANQSLPTTSELQLV